MLLIEFTQPNIKPNDIDHIIYRKFSQIVASEISNISRPCYMPKFIKYFGDIQRMLNIDNVVTNKFLNSFDNAYYKKFNVFTDKHTLTLFISVIHYSRNNKKDIARIIFEYLGLKFYSSLVHRFLPKYCYENFWNSALEKVSPKHLFKVHRGIPNAIMYVSDSVFERNFDKLSSEDLKEEDILNILYSQLRTRIMQSVKSFFELYHKISTEVRGKTDNQESELDAKDEELQGIQLVSEKISMTMCTYKQIDTTALYDAMKLTGSDKVLSTTIITEMSDTKYKDNIKFIIVLLSRISSLKNTCIEIERNKLIRKVISDTAKFGNYSVKSEIIKLLNLLSIKHKIKKSNKDQLILFLTRYIMFYVRNRIC